MSQPIVYVDTSTIRSGKLEVVKQEIERLVEFVDANMPRLISYGFYFDEAETQMTVVAVHPDSASMIHHMDVGRPEFQKFGDLIELQRIEVYGHVTDEVLDRLHKKAEMLGTGTVAVHELRAGFHRN